MRSRGDVHRRGAGDVAAGFCRHDRVVAGLNVPVGNIGAVIRERTLCERKGDGLLLARLEFDLFKTAQLFYGTNGAAFRHADVQLHDLFALHLAGVADVDGDGQRIGIIHLGLIKR